MMLEEMPAGLLWEWVAFSHVAPFGPERADLRAGIVASVVANSSRNPKKKPKPFSPGDFMPKFERPKKVQTWEEQLAIVVELNQALGGQDLRKNRGGPN